MRVILRNKPAQTVAWAGLLMDQTNVSIRCLLVATGGYIASKYRSYACWNAATI